MDFESTADFFGDFDVPVVWQKDENTTITTTGFLDAPDKAMELGYTVMGNEYAVTFVTAELDGIANDALITVDGDTYKIKDTASIGDGVLSRALLRKV